MKFGPTKLSLSVFVLFCVASPLADTMEITFIESGRTNYAIGVEKTDGERVDSTVRLETRRLRVCVRSRISWIGMLKSETSRLPVCWTGYGRVALSETSRLTAGHLKNSWGLGCLLPDMRIKALPNLSPKTITVFPASKVTGSSAWSAGIRPPPVPPAC